MTRDPIGYRGSDQNIYEYVFGNPLGFKDPTGLIVANCTCSCSRGVSAIGPGSAGASIETDISFFVAGGMAGCRQACDNYGSNKGWSCKYKVAGAVTGTESQLANLCRGIKACPECSLNACENYMARILNARENANRTVSRFWTSRQWAEGYCHAWSIRFLDKIGADEDDSKACISVRNFIIDLDPNVKPDALTEWEDHNVNIIKNTCTGKCMLVDNGAYGGIVDPCSLPAIRPSFTEQGQKKWDDIRKMCGCKKKAGASAKY